MKICIGTRKRSAVAGVPLIDSPSRTAFTFAGNIRDKQQAQTNPCQPACSREEQANGSCDFENPSDKYDSGRVRSPVGNHLLEIMT
jgi:hypothetical protein